MQDAYEALASQNRQSSFEEGGAGAVQGTLTIDTDKNIEVKSATMYGQEGVNLTVKESINLEGTVDLYISHINDDPTNQNIEHSFKGIPAVVASKKYQVEGARCFYYREQQWIRKETLQLLLVLQQ